MASPDPPERIGIPISWVGYDEVPIAYANQFLLQAQPEECFIMGIGQSTPPALIGSAEEIAEQAAQVEFVSVRTLAKVALTEAKMKELIAVLQVSVDRAEQARRSTDPRRGGEPT